ncbi:hypothetical protein REPUB_Repub05bG0029000 [Reevesia pubescens]
MSNIEKFRLKCRQGQGVDSCRVFGWLRDVLLHDVRKLDLNLSVEKFTLLPDSLFACKTLVKLKLDIIGLVLNVPMDVCFPNLKTLYLKSVEFKDDNYSLLNLHSLFEARVVFYLKKQSTNTYHHHQDAVKNLFKGINGVRILALAFDSLKGEVTDGTWTPPEKVPSCLLTHLKAVLIFSFNGQMEMVEYFLKSGRVLEKLLLKFKNESAGRKREIQDHQRIVDSTEGISELPNQYSMIVFPSLSFLCMKSSLRSH